MISLKSLFGLGKKEESFNEALLNLIEKGLIETRVCEITGKTLISLTRQGKNVANVLANSGE